MSSAYKLSILDNFQMRAIITKLNTTYKIIQITSTEGPNWFDYNVLFEYEDVILLFSNDPTITNKEELFNELKTNMENIIDTYEDFCKMSYRYKTYTEGFDSLIFDVIVSKYKKELQIHNISSDWLRDEVEHYIDILVNENNNIMPFKKLYKYTLENFKFKN